MKLNISKEQFCKIGVEYQNLFEKSEAYCEQVKSVNLGDFIVEINSPYYDFFSHTLHSLFDTEVAEYIEWFIFDTEFGTKNINSCTITIQEGDTVSKKWLIDSWDALYDFLEEEYFNVNEESV